MRMVAFMFVCKLCSFCEWCLACWRFSSLRLVFFQVVGCIEVKFSVQDPRTILLLICRREEKGKGRKLV